MVQPISALTYSTTKSEVNRCVHGGPHGDFNWPFNVPDSAFGPWSPRCKSEILDPTAPCKPYVPGEPCNFKELAYELSEVLHAVVTLCYNIPPADSNGDYDWIDPRLLAIDKWLDFNWLRCYNSVSADLQAGVRHYLFVILKEATLRQNYVYFTKFPPLADALRVIHDNFNGCDWLTFDRQIESIVDLILTYGLNKEALENQLKISFIDPADSTWVEDNNKKLIRQKNYSLTKAQEIVAKNLTIHETLKLYTQDPEVLRFEIDVSNCKGTNHYTLRYGNDKFRVRTNNDFGTVCKQVFGS